MTRIRRKLVPNEGASIGGGGGGGGNRSGEAFAAAREEESIANFLELIVIVYVNRSVDWFRNCEK